MSGDQELDLIRRVAARDRRAFEELYTLYHPRLFRFLLRFMRRTDTVEETLNDAMLVVWRKAAGFRGRSRVSTWIFGIAYRKALKGVARRERLSVEVSADETGVAERGEADPAFERRELADLLQRALDRLSPEQRAVVELTYYHGYSYREIAEIVGCPVNTVKTRMFHARRRLRRALPRLSSGRRGGRSRGV